MSIYVIGVSGDALSSYNYVILHQSLPKKEAYFFKFLPKMSLPRRDNISRGTYYIPKLNVCEICMKYVCDYKTVFTDKYNVNNSQI
jgi:hypothetical protein